MNKENCALKLVDEIILNPTVFWGSLGTFLNVLVVYFLSVVCSDVVTVDKNVIHMKIIIYPYL